LDALRSTDEALTEVIADKNLERIVSFYAADASILPVQEPIVSGKEAIRDEWSKL
jgi:ketosteroid isomerase-like protein